MWNSYEENIKTWDKCVIGSKQEIALSCLLPLGFSWRFMGWEKHAIPENKK